MKIRPGADGKVSLNFKGHSWQSVMEWIADISGMSLDWQELPEGYLNLITEKHHTVEEARDLINRHLLARGYTMLIQDSVISVSKMASINPGMVPRVSPEGLAKCQAYDFVKVSFRLDWLLAEKAVIELKPMMSPNGKLTALPATNRLEAMDAAINLQQIYAVLKEEQSDSGQDRLVREFPLKNSSSEEVVEQLNKLLGMKSDTGPPRPMSPQEMEVMHRQAQMQAEMAKNAGKGPAPPMEKTDVYLLANTRHNSVIANAPPDKMAVIAEAVRILDVASVPAESIIENVNRIQIYRLEKVEPAAVVKMIEEMGTLDPTTRLEVDEENRAIIASATLVDHVTIRTLVDRLDHGGRKSVVLPLTELRAEMVAKQINFLMGGGEETESATQNENSRKFFDPFNPYGRSFSQSRSGQSSDQQDKFRVSADVKNNALILWCNEFELKKIENLLEQLGAMPQSDGGTFEVRVYRLNTLDPEPLVTTLMDMDALGVHASMEADKESKSIVAYATAADHAKIQGLIDRLDSTGRKFEVVQLRRLQADYVAGTIEFMMASGKEEQTSSNRHYWDYDSRRGNDENKEDPGFKIDADVENNRLLLLANEAEMAEVTNLLVKLGEIPSEGGDPSTIRVIDSLPGPELEQLLKQIEKAWPSVAPNPLLLPDKDGMPKEKQAEPSHEAKETDVRTTTAEDVAATPRFIFADQETTTEHAEEMPAAAGEPVTAMEEKAVEGVAAAGKKSTTATGKAPVSITVGPDGRLVIASEDTRTLDRLQELLTNLAPERPDYQIFQLKYSWAISVASTLEDIFKEKEDANGGDRTHYFYDAYGSGNNNKDEKLRLSKRRPLKFIPDSQSNSILVQKADAGQLKVIGELIEFYDQPEPSDSQSVRKTE
ncbi:MAG: secretin N-terminal domain-containing protein, partial [Thermoguttaceae bacterium]